MCGEMIHKNKPQQTSACHLCVVNWLYIKQIFFIMYILYMECLENAATCIEVTQEQRNVFIKEGSKAVHVETVPQRRMHPVLAAPLNKYTRWEVWNNMAKEDLTAY